MHDRGAMFPVEEELQAGPALQSPEADETRPAGSAGELPRAARNWLRGIAIFMVLVQFWTLRYTLMSDGISYLDIARNYAAGNWKMAVNAYWSPLLSWLLAPVLFVLGPDRRNDLVVLHAMNLLALLAALFLLERLMGRLSDLVTWRHETARKIYALCGYFAFYVAALDAVNVSLTSPDVLVFALVILLALLVLRIRTDACRWRTLSLFGTVLGVVYLAKTAILATAPVYIAAALWPLKWHRDLVKKLALVCVPLLLIALPWIAALRVTKGYWTIGDSGKLNFVWEMCGAARWMHWQGEPGTIGKPLHPTRQVMTSPAVYEFNGVIADASTYAPWYDPAYWYAGVKPTFSAISSDGWKNFVRNARYLGWLLLIAPGLAPALAFLPLALGRAREHKEPVRVLLAVAIPAAALLPMYACVFVDKRYVAGQVLVLTLVSLATVLSQLDRKWQRDFCYVGSFTTCLGLVLLPSLTNAVMLGNDFIQISSSRWDFHARVRDAVWDVGLRPGDRISYIGLGVRAYWPALLGLHIVSEIPVRAVRRGSKWDNQDTDDSFDVDQFWNSPRARQDYILELLHRSGAKAVVSDWVPPGADTRGWIKLNSPLLWRSGEAAKVNEEAYRHDIYVRLF